MKKKKILIFVIISILIVASIILISPSILNKNKASLGEIVPANSAFDDINFYTCVVSSLPSNEENDMEIYFFGNCSLHFGYFFSGSKVNEGIFLVDVDSYFFYSFF